MNEEEYLDERLNGQIKWYDYKSATNKKWYRICQLTQLVMASLITLSGIFAPDDYPWIYFTIPVLGAVIAMLSGALGLFKFEENWLEYRTTTESLRYEKYLFLTNSTPYDVETPLNLLVSRVEILISKENTNWAQYMRKTSEENI
jgi:hypothetical protein